MRGSTVTRSGERRGAGGDRLATTVLPVKPLTICGILCLSGLSGYWRRQLRWLDGLFDSISSFWLGARPLQIRVVVSAAALTEASRSLIRVPGVELEFVAEEEFITATAGDHESTETFRRSLINLVSAKTSDADFLLTLAPSMFFIDFFDTGILLPDGRSLACWETTRQTPAKWAESAHLLDMTLLPARALATGPAILRRVGAAMTLTRISNRSAEDAATTLQRAAVNGISGWCDTSLYSLANARELVEWHHGSSTDAEHRREPLYSMLPEMTATLFQDWAHDTKARAPELGRCLYWDPERFSDPEKLLSQLYWILPR